MDKQTSEKLMGAVGEGSSTDTNASSGKSSDMSFYVIMLALIVGMAFYVSYDKEQRYGSGSSVATATSDIQVIEPVVVGIEKVKTVEVKPVAIIPATETTPEALVLEKIENETIVTTAVAPVVAAPALESAPVVSDPVAAPAPASSLMMPMVDNMMKSAETVAAPVVNAVEAIAAKTETMVESEVAPALAAVPAPVSQAQQPQQAPQEQAYSPYNYQQYGQPQNSYQQPQNNYQQPQYNNQYGNPYGNQYSNPYGNQNSNPYGYGNNPYQRPTSQ